ncbi:MAG: hypothetical protein K2N06_03960 [Oscillospiraceae bacterium]|nr:hypothetical protein [Oscillospiraceae bacterium]
MKKAIFNRIGIALLSAVIICLSCSLPSYAATNNRIFFGVGIDFYNGIDRWQWLYELDTEISNIVKDKGYSDSQKVRKINADDALRVLRDEAGIFAVHSHGSATSVCFSNNTEITISQINALGANALSNVDMVIYGTCRAANGGISASNMVNSTFKKGAKVVIGFEELTYVDQMNQWLLDFFKSYSKGKSVTKSASDGLYWAKFWHFGNAGGTDKVLIRQ